MNSDKLNYFLTAANYLNISLAAQKLYISQPALSRQLASIEQEWDVVLFNRTTKKMELTAAGALLFDELPKLMENYDTLISHARKLQESEAAKLDIAFLEGHLVPQELMDAINELTAAYPHISIHTHRFSFKELAESLNFKNIDLIFTVDFNIEGLSDLSVMSLSFSDTYAVMGKQYLVHKGIPRQFADLARETFIIISPESYPAAASLTLAACQEAGFTPRTKAARNFDELQLFVEAGQGIGIVSQFSMLANSSHIQTFTFPELKKRNYVIAWKENSRSWVLNKLLGIIKSRCSEI